MGMSPASTLPLTPHTCPASLWLVQQVEHTSDLCVGFNLRTSTKECVSLHLPGLVYPEETKFISNLKDMEQSQQEEKFALIPSTVQELEEMLRLCCYNQPKLPRQVRPRAGFRASAIAAVSVHSLHPQSSLRPFLLSCWDVKHKSKQTEINDDNSTFKTVEMFCSCRKGSTCAVTQVLNLTC